MAFTSYMNFHMQFCQTKKKQNLTCEKSIVCTFWTEMQKLNRTDCEGCRLWIRRFSSHQQWFDHRPHRTSDCSPWLLWMGIVYWWAGGTSHGRLSQYWTRRARMNAGSCFKELSMVGKKKHNIVNSVHFPSSPQMQLCCIHSRWLKSWI